MNRSSTVANATALVQAVLTWVFDPEDEGWFVATFLGQAVYMRINNFPDENLYSVWLGDGWLDFDDLPANWSVEFPIDGWPAGARPALPKGRFHDE